MRRVVDLGRGSARLGRRAGPAPARRRSRLTLRDRSSLTGRRAGPCIGGLAHRRPAWSASARARCALRPHCRARPRATVVVCLRSSCAARPPRRSRSRSPPIAAHSARSRLAAAPPRLITRQRARSPPTGLVGGCSHLQCSAHSAAMRARGQRVVVFVRGECAARLPRRSRTRSPLIAARFVRSRLAAAPACLIARRRARLPPAGLVDDFSS